MNRQSEFKNRVIMWWSDRGEAVIKAIYERGRIPTNKLITDVAVVEIGDKAYSPMTYLKHITKIRAGEYDMNPIATNQEIVAQISANIAEAGKVFVRHEQPSVPIDLDPLGLGLDEEVKRVMFDVPETYASHDAPLKLDGYGIKMGVISDIHFPLHDRVDVIAAHSWLKSQNIDCLLLLGDIMDNSNVTRHIHRQSLTYTWREELEVGRSYIKGLRVLFPKIPIVYAEGNHESWLQQFLVKQAPQLENDYLLQERLLLKEHDIEWVHEYRLMSYGHLFLHHGHMLGVKGGENIAAKILKEHASNIMIGHFHRQMMADKRYPLTGELKAVWINGSLSHYHPKYSPYGNTTHGLATVELRDNGMFAVKQVKVYNGKIIE